MANEPTPDAEIEVDTSDYRRIPDGVKVAIGIAAAVAAAAAAYDASHDGLTSFEDKANGFAQRFKNRKNNTPANSAE